MESDRENGHGMAKVQPGGVAKTEVQSIDAAGPQEVIELTGKVVDGKLVLFVSTP